MNLGWVKPSRGGPDWFPRPWWRWGAAPLVLVAGLGAAARAEAAPPDLAWVPAMELRRVELAYHAPVATLLPVEEPAAPVELGAEEALLVPAAGGTVLRVEGDAVEIGFGTGQGAAPDAVLWQPGSGSTRVQEVRVPTWGTNQVVVVRGRGGQPATVTVRVAARRTDPMLWYRTDREIAAWLRAPAGTPPPELPNPVDDAEPTLRLLAAAREAFGPDATEPAVCSLLTALWLADSGAERPMSGPFYASAAVRLTGGSLPPQALRLGQRPLPRRIVAAGQSLLVEGKDLDVVTVQLSTRGDRSSLLRVFAGDALLQEVRTEVPEHARDVERWTPRRLLRATPAQGHLRIDVVAGTTELTVSGYQERSPVRAPRSRERARLLRRAGAESDEPAATIPLAAAAALARAEATKTRASVAALLALADQREVSPGLRALLLYAALRNGLDFATVAPRLEALREATASMPPSVALPLRRAALERVVDATSAAPPALEGNVLTGFAPADASGDDAELLVLFAELLRPPRDRARSATAERAEDVAASSALRADRLRLAGQAWRRIAPWANVEAGDGSPSVRRFTVAVPEPESDGLCPMSDSSGTRWLHLDATARLHLSERGGTHSEIVLVGDPASPPGDSLVAVDDVTLAVHGGAALTSLAAVAPGDRRFGLVRGAPVLAKIPADDRLDCGRLRDEVNWVFVRDEALFLLPPGVTRTVASVVVAAESLPRPAEVEVTVGGAKYRGQVRAPASGALEVPIPAGATALSVRVSAPLLLRVMMRMHRAPAAKPRPATAAEPPPSEAESLAELRSATHALRSAADAAGRRQAWSARARALDALGFRRLAAADRARFVAEGGIAEAPPPAPSLAPLTLNLPPGSPAVVPLGSLPLIPPLPLPAADEVLRRVVAEREEGVEPTRLIDELAASAGSSTAVDALLLAVLAEDHARPALAASAYARLGRAHHSARALALASSLSADAALTTGELDAVLGAYILAREAGEDDARAAGVLGRLQDSFDWEQVMADEAAGSAIVEAYRYVDFDSAPLGVRVRRSLLDAPPFAVMSYGDPVSTPLREGGSYRLDVLCHGVDGPGEGCPLRVELDGRPALCRPLAGDAEPLTTDADAAAHPWAPGTIGEESRVAQEQACWIEVPEGSGRLVVTPPGSREVLAWVVVRQVTEAGLVPTRMVSRWAEATPEAPFRLVLNGPAVLRLTARGEGGTVQSLVRSIKGPVGSSPVTTPLDPRPDEYAWRRPERGAIGVATSTYVTLAERGRYAIALAPEHGRALLRVEVARARALPRPAQSSSKPQPVPSLGERVPPPSEVLPVVGWDPEPGPFTLSAAAGYVIADVSEADRDPSTDYFGATLSVRRAVKDYPLWLRGTLLTRVRRGPETVGVEARASLGRTAYHPAGYVLGRVLEQRVPRGAAVGFLGVASAYHTVRLSRDVDFVPVGTLTTRVIDPRARGEDGADAGVYSAYSAAHPASLDLVARLDDRPLLDLRGRAGTLVRLLPERDAVDRLEAFVQTAFLGGRLDAPSLDFELRVSHRPPTVVRDAAFTRLMAGGTLGMGAWVYDSGRFTLDSSLTWFANWPDRSAQGSQVAGMLWLGYDFLPRCGLRDLEPGERTFQPRQEEGHAPAERVAPRGHPYWEPSP